MTYGAGFKYVILVVSARPTNKRPRDLAHVRFVSEREQPMTRQAVNYIVARAGERADLGRVRT
jgi:site-specific recombinase XerD